MNGVLSLGHFCETHGPCVILCTQAISEKRPNQPPHSLTVPWCNACKSIEVNEAFVSHDGDTTTYVTTRTALKQDMAFLLKQACVRSLSCEEETGKEGGTVYFGDCERGHVLSYTFRLPDSLARGFHRLFTIILLMRDKVHLLNSWPFITTHVRELISHLKENAQKVNENEQSERSQRVHRLATGTPVGSPRSLVQLTNQPGVFGHVHLWFTWILKAGSQVMTEQTNIPINSPPWLGSETDEGFTLVQIAKVPSTSDCCIINSMNIRELYHLLNAEKFKTLCYCVLLGLQVVVRGKQEIVASILNVLSTLLPKNWCKKILYSEEYLRPDVCNFLGMGLHIAVPQTNDTIVRLDIVDNNYHLKWTGLLPTKLPNLLTKLIKSIEDNRLENEVLNVQINVFIEEWSNNAQTLFWAQSNNSPDKLECLMKVLGIQSCDTLLMKYWILQIGLYSKASYNNI